MDLKEEIKNSIKLSHVVGKNLSLKRRDKSNYVALCPFHKEKTPSFNILDDKGFYHCFGCGKNGDIFNYVMEMENISFVEALKRLAEQAGIKHNGFELSPNPKITKLFKLLKRVSDSYVQNLKAPIGQKARQYLNERGIDNLIIKNLLIGYSGNSKSNQFLVSCLLREGFSTDEIIEVGKRTVIDLGIHGLNPALIKAVGRMKYRSSYGQNLLQHSREVAKLCGIMSSELGLNPKLAKRAGLLHDIGKVPEEEIETPHALLGMQWAEKYGEKPDVCNAIGAHHDEIEMNNLISPIVQVCDAISGARPGARRQVLDSYIQRLKEMEDIAYDFKGVNKAFAIQAGRELRVMVESEKISDDQATKLSFQISQKIQTDMTYPGQVKVTVIRETRSVHIAT